MRRLTILIAALGALLLIPAAQAFAANNAFVEIEGTGSGELVPIPAQESIAGNPKINCKYTSPGPATGTCATEAYEEEPFHFLGVKAIPAPGSELVEWKVVKGTKVTNRCEATNPGTEEDLCSVYSFGTELKIKAVFEGEPEAEPEYDVHIAIEGNGSGNVVGFGGTPGEPPVACEWNGETEAQTGVCDTESQLQGLYGINVTEEAAEGSEFAGWTVEEGFGIGCEEPLAPVCGVVVFEKGEGEIKIKATFTAEEEPPVEEPNLKVNVEEGEGTVVSSPTGIECGATCEAEFEEGGKVTLTASPAPGYLFKSWKKCDSGGVNGRQCTVTATSSLKEVGAKFIPAYSLEGSKTGGLGILNTSPGGVNCGYACSSSTALYKGGSVTVKNKAAKHYHFVKYTGGTGSAAVCNEETTCSFTIGEDSSIEEVYAPDATSTLSLAKEGGGQGFVKTKPTNINCGYTCTAAEASFYASETSVPVTVTLGKGTSSVTWVSGSGSCTGNATSCTVDMSSSHELVAKFE